MVSVRKDILANGCVYHIFNKSISGYEIFNNPGEYGRFLSTFLYSNVVNTKFSFSKFFRSKSNDLNLKKDEEHFVKIIAYCIMPTHFHFVVKQNRETGIEKFISKMSNSYAKYFNLKHNRSGPL
ncbi:MAG: transposase, partial [Elusimicrobia bacterium]|nr:transposase [Elusimicrobiota bacterium]